jgi:hypothetical protein
MTLIARIGSDECTFDAQLHVHNRLDRYRRTILAPHRERECSEACLGDLIAALKTVAVRAFIEPA